MQLQSSLLTASKMLAQFFRCTATRLSCILDSLLRMGNNLSSLGCDRGYGQPYPAVVSSQQELKLAACPVEPAPEDVSEEAQKDSGESLNDFMGRLEEALLRLKFIGLSSLFEDDGTSSAEKHH